jgi:hypothetical protein
MMALEAIDPSISGHLEIPLVKGNQCFLGAVSQVFPGFPSAILLFISLL